MKEKQGKGGEIEQGKRRVELMKKKRKSKNKGWVGRQERIDGRRKKREGKILKDDTEGLYRTKEDGQEMGEDE